MSKIKTIEDELNPRNEIPGPAVPPQAAAEHADEDEDFYSLLMVHGQDNYETQQQLPIDDIPVEAQVNAEIAFYKVL